MKTALCRCAAYKFPHRKDGGRCVADTRDDQGEGIRHRRNIDHILDDPRRGQAESINRRNR